MKIAVTAKGASLNSEIDPRFGRAKYFVIIDPDNDRITSHDNFQNLNAAQGAGIQAAQNVAALGAQAVISGNVGPKAFRALKAAGIKIFLGETGTVEDAISRFRKGELKEADGANVEGHW